MTIEIRPFAGDAYAWMEAVMLPFGRPSRREDVDVFAALIELDRSMAAYDGERPVGTAGAYSMRLAVPGGELPMAGVTMVGVHPTHRRQGILRAMMRRQLDEIHERGAEPIAGLWASEGAIYQRFGYGLATFSAHFEIERVRASFRGPHAPSGTLRLVDVDEASRAFPGIFDAIAGSRPGIFARSEAYWPSEFFYDPEHAREGGPPVSLLLHETGGRPTGYARYRITPEWDERGPKAALEVHEAVGVTPDATLDLWRYLLDVDLVATIRGRNLPIDHPLLFVLSEPRRLGWGVSDGLWLRIVDVPAALAGRGWGADGELALAIADEFCAWNAGTWRIITTGGRAEVQRTDAAPDLELEAADLAATYLGGASIRTLAAAGRVRAVTPGAVERAEAMLLGGPVPWCPQMF